jgi:AraC family transcriptional regulator
MLADELRHARSHSFGWIGVIRGLAAPVARMVSDILIETPKSRGNRRDGLFAQDSTRKWADRFLTEDSLLFPAGRIQVVNFCWSRPMEVIWETGDRCYLFDLLLSNKSNSTTRTRPGTRSQRPSRGGSGLTFLPPGQKLRTRFPDARAARSLRFMLDTAVIEAFVRHLLRWIENPALLNACASLSGSAAVRLLRRMYQEMKGADFGCVAVLQGLATQLAGETIRTFKLGGTVSHFAGRLAPWRMQLIQQRIYSTAPLPDLEEVATLCGLTIRHLSRAFRAETGQTLGAFIDSVMVERAYALLQSGMTLTGIAHRLGYSHACGFAAAFRRTTGRRPSDVQGEHPNTRPPPSALDACAPAVNPRINGHP